MFNYCIVFHSCWLQIKKNKKKENLGHIQVVVETIYYVYKTKIFSCNYAIMLRFAKLNTTDEREFMSYPTQRIIFLLYVKSVLH